MTNSLVRLDQKPKFPKLWSQFIDEILTLYVKKAYSPKWKDKPFNDQDAKFFSKGIQELSELLTEFRDKELQAGRYLENPKYRSSYLLYFLPFQGAKFLALFDQHDAAMQDLLNEDANKVIRILDAGSGPGTASIALLIWILEKSKPRPIEFIWIESNRKIAEDGRSLIQAILDANPAWKSQVQLKIEFRDWTRHLDQVPECQFTIFGHVLNENSLKQKDVELILKRVQTKKGAGVLFLEPASKKTSRVLVDVREFLRQEYSDLSFYGPCLHAGTCPFSHGRDWCHFSIPAELPGRWLRKFSIGIGSKREWLKFSYLWTAGSSKIKNPPDWFRVLSDPIKTQTTTRSLLCQPEDVKIIPTPRGQLWRGALIQVSLKADGNPVLQPKNRPNRRGKSIRRTSG